MSNPVLGLVLDSFPAYSSLKSLFLARDHSEREGREGVAGCSRPELLSPYMSFGWDAVLAGSGSAAVCFGAGQKAVAFLPLLPHCVKEPPHRCSPRVNEALRSCSSSPFSFFFLK